MANSDKNIRIQPNRNSTLFPKITFTGQSNNPITLNVLDDNSISFEGSAGQLFSINNNLSSGYIFSVNDISGLPSFRINADGTVGIAEFFGNVGIGITNPSYKFHARGDSYFSSTGNTALLLLSGSGGTIIASNSVNITLTDPARKGLVINAANSQTANIFEWYADGGVGGGYSLAGTIRPSGQVHLGSPGLTMSNGGSALLGLQGRGSSEGLAIRGYNSNSTNPLFEIQGNAGNQLFGIYGDGGVNAPRINVTNGTASTATNNGALIVTGGVGIGGSVNIGSALTVSGTTRLNSSLFNIPPTSSIGGTSGSATFGSFWTGYQVENGYLIYGRQVSGGSIIITEPLTGAQVGGTSNIFAEALKHFKWGKDKYVVLASTGNSILYSTSPVGAGSSWAFATLPTTASWQRLEYGNNRFVAIATGTTAAYSYDGITWSLASLPSNIAWSDIKYGNGVFVAGAGSTVAYSYDGIDWAIASNNVAASNLTYGNGFFFANATGNTASYSSDGINWTNVTLPSDTHRGSAYGNGVFFNVGASSSNYISSDLINWTATANGVGSLSVPNSPWYVNNTFFWNNNASSFGAFVAGPSGTLDLNPRFTGDINNVEIGGIKPAAAEFTTLAASGPVRFVSGLASTGFRNGSVVITGGVGIGGTLNVNNIGIGYTGIPYSPSIAFIGTTGDPIRLNVLSNNTLSFEGRSGQLFSINNNLSSGWIFSVNDISGIPLFRANADATISMAEYAGNVGIGLSNPTFKFQVAGSASIGATLNVNRLRVTSKITFEPGTGTSAVSGWTGIGLTSISKMIYAANRFVGVGGSYVAYSDNGVNFTYTTIPGQTSAASYGDIAYGNGVFVAVNAQNVNSTAYSYDGASWGTTSIATGIHRTVGFGNGKFFTTAEAGGNAYISTDGRNWSIVGNLGGFGREIYFANGYFLSPRGLNLYYSVDAASWKLANTPGSNSIHAITYGKGLYLAADYNSAQYYTSTDLVTWTRRTIDNLVWTGASYVNGVFYLIPNNYGAIYHSLDGINWSTTNFGTPIGGINKLFTANDRLYFYSSWNTTLWSTDATTGTLMAKPFYNGELENTRIGAVNPDSATFTNLTALNPVTFTSATASTAADNGALVVTGGVGIGGTLNAGSVNVVRDFNHTPNITTIGGASGWVASTASAFISPYSFKYLNNKYIGIGGTYVYYSDDMINWSSVMVPNLNPAQSIYDITYGEGKYVITQYLSSNAGYSTNLTNWTVNSALTYNSWLMLEYGNGRFVATSGGNPYAYSLDGITWANTSSSTHGYSTDIKFLNGYFYSCSSGSLERSTDGITWQTCNTPAIPYGLAYGNGLYVGGVYNSGTIVYSYDGLNFSSYTGPSYVHKKAYFFNGVYYITTQNNAVIRYSTDGFNWSNSTGFPGNVDGMAYAQGRLYAGSGNTVWVTNATPGRFEVNPLRAGTLDDVEIGRLSPNNANFIDVSVNNNLNVSSQYDSSSYLDGALTVAGGVGIGKTLNTNSARVLNNFNHTPSTGSTGGITWTSVAFPSIPGLANNGFDNSVVYGRDKFVGIGGTNVFYSYDSYNWFYAPIASATTPRAITYGNDMYIAINNTGNGAYYSYNGINWSTTTLANSTTNGDKACFGNGRFVYNDQSGNVGISTNGINWTVTSVLSGGAYPYGVDYANGWFFARWQNNYFRSADLINWNRFSLPADSGRSKIFFSKNKYYAPNNNASTYFVSDDGFNWTTQAVTNALWINMYDYFGTLYLIRSSSNAVSYSEDGINWATASLGGTSNTNATGLVYGNGRFVYVGSSPNLIFSGNAPVGVSHINTPRTSELDNVRIGANSPASAQVTGLNALGSVNFSSTTNSTSPFNGALTVTGGVGVGGTLTANDVNVVSRLTSFASFGSTGGLNWTSATVPANYTEVFNSIVYGNGKFAAVGYTAVLTSTDAVTWEVKNISWPSVPNNSTIKFLNSKFIVVAANNSYIAYSDDAVTWQTSTTPVLSGSMVYNNGRYYKYSGSTVGISTNLSNWTTQTSNGSPYRVLNGYFYNNSQRSIDGINFESLVFPNVTPTDINYGNGIYFGAVYNSSIYYTSTDGLNFTQSTIESNVYLGAEYYNGVYYLRCQHNIPKLYYSLDGYNYSSVNLFSNQYNVSMAFGNNKIVYIGFNPSQINFLAYADATRGVVDLNTKFEGSIDNVVIGRRNARSASFLDVGISGKIVSNNTASSSTLSNNSAVFAGGVGIGGTLTVVGSVNISNSLNLVNTTTGIATTWTRTVVGTAATISYLAYANNLYVGVGYSSITSTDGVNWTTRTLPNNLSFVSYGNGIWSGLLFNSALGATSTNGTSWTSYAMTNSRQWTMMAFGNNTFVTLARATNIAAYSTNGYNWTEVSLPTTGSPVWVWLTYGGGYFVGVANGSATAVYSTDGINWSTTTLPSAGGWNSVTYGNGYFYVTGSSGGGVYSRDLINWTSYSHTISGSAYAAYNNGAFVVADVNGATRTNIITGDFTSRTQIDLPGPQIPTALVAGDRNFIAGFGQTFYTFPIPNNSITLSPNTTGEINNVEIGNIKPAAGNFSNIFSQGLVTIGATTRSTSPYNGALTVSGGVGIGGSLNIGSDVIINGGRESSSTSTGSLIVRGGVGITGGLYVRPFSLSTKGLVVQANSSQTGNLFELQNSASSNITSFNSSGELNITSTTGSTSAAFGSIVTAGGVGIGGSVSIGSTAASSNTTSGALKVVGGVGIGGTLNVGGSVNFSSSIFGGVSTSIVPTMTFIGQANDPITLSVLSDNSLSFDGSSGQLFSINNNLSTGWIFSISDISGLPLFRTNADGTVSMGEFGGNVGIGITNPTFKLQVAGRASIGNTLFVTGNAHFGTSAYYDTYAAYNSPVVTITDNFAGDMGLQIQNKSNDLNARSGVSIYNDANDYFSMYLGSSDYAGTGQSSAFIDTIRYLDISAGNGMIFRTGSGNIIDISGAKLTLSQTTESTSSTTGSLIINGGAGIAKSVNIGGFLSSKPAFVTAGLATDQTIPSNVDQLLIFTDNTDTNNWWTGTAAIGVSHRFKPNIAGTYFVALQVHFKQTTGTGQMNIQARKNANTFSLAIADLTTTTSGHTLNATGAISMDGNTDYLDFTAYSNSSGSQVITGDAGRAWTQVTIYKLF